MTHENYKELITANALTALDAADARALAAHLDTCAECRKEMDEWESTAALLAFESQPIEPSNMVRERIIAEVRAESQAAGRGNVSQSDSSWAGQTRVESNVVGFELRKKTRRASFGSYYAIAASIALISLAVSLFVIWQQNRAAKAELAKLAVEKSEAEKQLAHERGVVALLTSRGARMAELAGTNMAPEAHAMIAYDKNGHAMLMAKGLPAAPSGKAYQLWFINGGKPMPGRVFTTDTQGNGSVEDQVPAEALNGTVFAITLEPAGGVQSPTGAIYLRSGA